MEKVLYLDCPYCNGRGEREYRNYHDTWPSMNECKSCEGTGKLEIGDGDEEDVGWWSHTIQTLFDNYEKWDENFRNRESRCYNLPED